MTERHKIANAISARRKPRKGIDGRKDSTNRRAKGTFYCKGNPLQLGKIKSKTLRKKNDQSQGVKGNTERKHTDARKDWIFVLNSEFGKEMEKPT